VKTRFSKVQDTYKFYVSRNWIKYPRFDGQFHHIFYAPHVQALSTDRAFSEPAKKLEVIELDPLMTDKTV
jgi:hypothetical protein